MENDGYERYPVNVRKHRQVLIKYTRLSVLCGTYCYNPQENTFDGIKECKQSN